EMRIRSPDRLLGLPSGFPLGIVPPKNLDERNSLFPHDSEHTNHGRERFFGFPSGPPVAKNGIRLFGVGRICSGLNEGKRTYMIWVKLVSKHRESAITIVDARNVRRPRQPVRESRKVMAISVISVSSDSSEDSMGTPAGRVILFGTIPTTIPNTTPVIAQPTTQIDTTVIPTETPIIAPTIPPSPDYTPASPDYSPASETEFDPSEDPSSGHILPLLTVSPFLSSDDDTTDSDTPDTPPSPTHDIPFTEITASTQRSPVIPRRRVMILAPRQPIPHGRPYRYHLNRPVHMMIVRKRVRPLPVQQLAMRHSVDHSTSRHSLSDHSSPDLPSTFAGPSRKRRRSPMTSVPALPPVSEALSPTRADLIPSPKRVRDIGYLADVEVTYKTLGDLVQRFHDHTQAIPVHCIQAIKGVQREQGHRTVGVESAVTALTERVAELERDNMRLRGTTSFECQRVDRLQHDMSLMFSDDFSEVEELVARRVTEAMEAREAAMNLEPLNESGDEKEGKNGGNKNGGNGENRNGNGENRNGKGGNKNRGRNGNGNENGNHGMNYGGSYQWLESACFKTSLSASHIIS
nr:hypothetical protein [Tanacetum cinerariifolium]